MDKKTVIFAFFSSSQILVQITVFLYSDSRQVAMSLKRDKVGIQILHLGPILSIFMDIISWH
jgi:hypothetical protein